MPLSSPTPEGMVPHIETTVIQEMVVSHQTGLLSTLVIYLRLQTGRRAPKRQQVRATSQRLSASTAVAMRSRAPRSPRGCHSASRILVSTSVGTKLATVAQWQDRQSAK